MSEDIRDVNQAFIATKVIARARKNGWVYDPEVESNLMPFGEAGQFLYDKTYFNHDFAKAFWKPNIVDGFDAVCNKCQYTHYEKVFGRKNVPEKYMCCRCGGKTNIELTFEDDFAWMTLLQEMVVEEHPIMYLKQFV
jgi:hypothetical protein